MPDQDETLLLHLNEAIATTRDKDSLFKVMTTKLRLIFPFDLIGINVFDADLKNKRLFLRDYYGTEESSSSVPDQMNCFTPIAGSPIEKLVADRRVRQITLRDYAADYPDYKPFCGCSSCRLRSSRPCRCARAAASLGSLFWLLVVRLT
jgi:hypothetical protein